MTINEHEKLAFASVVNRFDTSNPHFLIYQCGWERNSPDKAPIHGSRTFALHYILSGEVIIEYKGKKFTLKAGDCFLLRPGRSMVYYPNPEKPASYYWFSATGGMAAGFFDSMGFSGENFYFSLSEDCGKKLTDIFRRSMSLSKTNKAVSHIFLYKGFYEICESITLEISETLPKKDISPFLSVPMAKALEIIGENYTDSEFSLEVLAKRLGYNSSYLSRLFKKELGMNFKAYIVQKRMHYAAILMRDGEKNINIIAEKVGIHDTAYFRKLYKKLNTNTPTAAIKKYNSKTQ